MIKRRKFNEVKKIMNEYVIPIVFGLRRIGKTTMLEQLKKEYKNSKIINWDSFDIQLMNDLDFFEYIKLECENNEILLFDEIQERKGWDIIIKNLFDEFVHFKKCKIVVTGSSSLILNGKELGLDRTRRIYVDTWDFDEYLKLTKKTKTIENFENFLGNGFPDLMKKNLENNYVDNLTNILKPIIFEDISRAFPKINSIAFLRCIVYLSKLTNGEVNETSISKKLEIQRITVRNYINILVETNLIKKIYKIDERGKLPKKKKYKIYLNPHFYIWLLKKPFKNLDEKIKGHIIESYWLHWALSINDFRKEFYYLKDSNTKKEIDFVSLNSDGSFKTLHEFKYKNRINISDIQYLLNIKSENKIIWTKNRVKNLLFKSISILDINDN